MNRSSMSSTPALPFAAMPMNACTADQTVAAPMANSARAWKPSTSSVPTISDIRFMRRWIWWVSCTVIATPPWPRSQLVLRIQALHFALQLVERANVGLRRRHHDVGVGADAVHDAAALRQAHGD